MAQRLLDKRCLIVGGTTGIGLATARRFLDEGARVVIAGRSPEKGQAALEELSAHGEAHFFACDAADESAVAELFDHAAAALGEIDVLYHVAGMSGRRYGDGPLHECTTAGWDTTLSANLKSVFLTNRAAVSRWMAAQRGGVILNMSSVLGFSPSPKFFDTYAYAAAKGGVIAMSRQAASRYAVHGIRINVIAPSLIETPMSTRAVENEQIMAFMRTKQPLVQGVGVPEDCAAAAVYLCGDESRFITGVVLNVDGGWSISEGQHPKE